MLVEINLIPQKELKSRAPLYVILLIVVITLIFSTIMLIQTKEKYQQLESVEAQIRKTEKLTSTLEQKLVHFKSNDSVETLKTAVDWAENASIDTVSLLKHLISLLPERGFFQSFSYNQDGSIALTIQFDTSSDAAYYLSRLTSSKWLKDAKILTISTREISDQSKQSDQEIIEQQENVLPRYIAVYQLKVDLEYIQNNESKKTKNESEGGDNS